jgi:Protein of unknown function (DUF2752)
MSRDLPPIFVSESSDLLTSPRQPPGGDATPPRLRRLIWSAIAFVSLSVVSIARWVEPDPRGFGTHLQLGLPPCAFHALTGAPCPTCGLTTSFAHMARLQITSSIAAHPLGLPLFTLTSIAIGVAVCGSLRAWPLESTFSRLRITRVAVIIAISAALSWLARLCALLLS